MTIHHYNSATPPAKDAAYTLCTPGAPRACRGLGLHPANLPAGWHPASERPDPPAETGYRWTDADPAWALVDGVSVPQGAWVEIPLAEHQANRAVAITAECESRFAARWPETDRVLSGGGVPLDPASPAAIQDAEDHQDARDAALILVEAATDAAGVAAVKVRWPE